jgi:hypothetical protein
MKNKIISELKYGSTWKLIGLFLITYGVYGAHYVKTKTSVINEQCQFNERISDAFINFIIVINYVSLALFFPYIFVEDTHPIAGLSGLVDFVAGVTFIVWGFMARKRLNMLLSSSKADGEWFHGAWTFLLSPFYFNFKVNKLSETVDPVTGDPVPFTTGSQSQDLDQQLRTLAKLRDDGVITEEDFRRKKKEILEL